MIAFLNECARAWYEPFGLLIVQNTVFLGIVFAALHWLRNGSARVRHAVAMLGLVKLILPPFMPVSGGGTSGYIDLSGFTTLPYQPALIPGVHAAQSEPLSWATIMMVIWILVAVGVFMHAVASTVRLRYAFRDAEYVLDADSARFTEETGIRVRIGDRVPVPMTVGVFPRTIFVPPHWRGWAPAGRRVVLRHEMEHIRRHDGLVRALETLVRSLYWFHPLVPLLVNRIDAYREQACDERAAAPEPGGRIAYSQQLVEIAEHLFERPGVRGSASALLRRRNELLGRINYLTREESIMKLSKTRALVFTIVLVAAATSLSLYRGAAMPPAPKNHASVQLSLAHDGRVAVAGEKTDLDKLGYAVKKEAGNREAVVHISCDDDVPMTKLFAVHAALREAGILKVSYAGVEGGEMPLVLPSDKLIQQTKTISEENIVHLDVNADGNCVIDGIKVTPAQIHKFVAKRLAENEYAIVSLKMAEAATYGQYIKALKELKMANATRIFINEPATL